MTLSNTKVKVTYVGDGLVRRFDVPFAVLDAADLAVFITGPDGELAAVESGFSVSADKTFVTYPANADKPALQKDFKITIMRQTPATQENDLIQQAVLHKESLETSLDKLTMISQEIRERLSRAVTVGPDENADGVSAAELIQQMRELYAQIKTEAQNAGDEAQKAIAAAVEAYEAAEKLYATVEYYDAGTPALNYDGGLTTIQLNEPYKADGNTLKVFVNGRLQRRGTDKDYVEVADPALEKNGDYYGNKIIFNSPLTAGDSLAFMFADTLTMPGGEVAQQAALAAEEAAEYAEEAQASAAAAAASAATFIPKQIGEVYQSQSALAGDNPGAVPGWTGQILINARQVWPALYAFVQAHTELQKTQTEYDALLAAKDEAHFYVLDAQGSGNLRLPTYSRPLGRTGSIVAAASAEYTKGESRSVGVTYTAEKDGWVFGEGHGYAAARVYITISGVKMPTYGSGDSSHNTPSYGSFLKPIRKGEPYVVTLTGNASCAVTFFPATGAHATDDQYDYPWIVAANSIEGLVKHNGGFITVKSYTQEEWTALSEKPANELSLVEEEEE